MKNNSSTNTPDGHRKRLRDKFIKSGLAGFTDYEIVELLLSLGTPRKDCKPQAREAIKNGKLLALCRIIPMEAYKIGGGSIRDWKNPYGDQQLTMDRWLQCYGKEESTVDGTGRKLWFNSKYALLSEEN